jgi:hypothetical protein
MIFVIKLIGIGVENTIEAYLDSKLMISPVSSTISMVENLSTFGADNFLEFVLSYVIEFGF